MFIIDRNYKHIVLRWFVGFAMFNINSILYIFLICYFLNRKTNKIRQYISLLFLNIIIFQFIVHYIYAFHIVLVFLLMIMYVITRRDKCMFRWYVKVKSQASANLTTIQAWFLKSKNTLRIEITYSLVFRLDIYIRQFIFNIALGNRSITARWYQK